MNFQPIRERGAISGEVGNGGAEAERVRLRFADADAKRRRWLNRRAYQEPSPNQFSRRQIPVCPVCGKRLRSREDGSTRERCQACERKAKAGIPRVRGAGGRWVKGVKQ